MDQQGVADNRREGGINSLMRKQAEVKTGITALWSYASVYRSNTISVHKWLDKINLYVFALHVVTDKGPCHMALQHQSAQDQRQPNQKASIQAEIWTLLQKKPQNTCTWNTLKHESFLLQNHDIDQWPENCLRIVTVKLTFDLWDTKQSMIPHTQLDIPLKSI